MRKLQRAFLSAAVLLISSCSPILVSNSSPAPKFPTCSTMQRVVKNNDQVEKVDWLNNLTVMLQLRERQSSDERDEFGDCPAVPAK